MRKFLTISLLAVLFCGVAYTLSADDSAAVGEKPGPARAALDAKVAELKAMPAAERRAELQKMAPAERRGLWFSLRKSLFDDHGGQPAANYAELMPGYPLNLPDGAPQTPQAKAVGTIAYDSGFPTIGFGGGAIVGNRFDTHTGVAVFASGTVSTVVAQVVPGPANTTSSAGFVLLGPQTVGGGAAALFSTFTAATGVIDSVSFTGLSVNYTGSSFFVLFGDFANSYIPVFGTGTTLAQGHHGVVGYTGGMGPNITGTFDFGGALNSFIRATGNIVPVELMAFDVE